MRIQLSLPDDQRSKVLKLENEVEELRSEIRFKVQVMREREKLISDLEKELETLGRDNQLLRELLDQEKKVVMERMDDLDPDPYRLHGLSLSHRLSRMTEEFGSDQSW